MWFINLSRLCIQAKEKKIIALHSGLNEQSYSVLGENALIHGKVAKSTAGVCGSWTPIRFIKYKFRT
jgi:hypothetical protein